MDEEVVMLEEQLASAHADIEQLQARLAGAEATEAQRARDISELQARVAAREEELTATAAELDELRGALERHQAEARETLDLYRDAVLTSEPDLPAEMVAGESLAELQEALTRARQTVSQVRRHIDRQSQALRVPAGAPVRGAADLSDLSASEKIRLGLRNASGP